MTRIIGVTDTQSWEPTMLGSSLTVWYDPSDSSTVTITSSKVSQINDKSGNARNATQSTADSRPTIDAAAQNGLDALRFNADATADWLSVPSTGVTAQPYLIFCAVKFNGSASSEMVLMNSNNVTIQDEGTTNKGVIYAGTSLFSGSHGGNWCVLGGYFNGASSVISMNGTATSGNAGTTAPSGATTRIGQRTDVTDNRLYGWLGDLLIVNGTLAAADRQRIEGYLAWKWGLNGSLNAAHPYKSGRP